MKIENTPNRPTAKCECGQQLHDVQLECSHGQQWCFLCDDTNCCDNNHGMAGDIQKCVAQKERYEQFMREHDGDASR